MAINHGNLEKHRYLPWFKAHYGVHAEVNGKEEEKGENGYGNGDSRPERTERGREQRKGEAGAIG